MCCRVAVRPVSIAKTPLISSDRYSRTSKSSGGMDRLSDCPRETRSWNTPSAVGPFRKGPRTSPRPRRCRSCSPSEARWCMPGSPHDRSCARRHRVCITGRVLLGTHRRPLLPGAAPYLPAPQWSSACPTLDPLRPSHAAPRASAATFANGWNGPCWTAGNCWMTRTSRSLRSGGRTAATFRSSRPASTPCSRSGTNRRTTRGRVSFPSPRPRWTGITWSST